MNRGECFKGDLISGKQANIPHIIPNNLARGRFYEQDATSISSRFGQILEEVVIGFRPDRNRAKLPASG